MTKEINVSIWNHRSARSLIFAWYYLKKGTSLLHEVNLKQFVSRKKMGPVKAAIAIVLKKKFWGFYRSGNPSEIHFWCHRDCKMIDVFSLISHEVSHSAGYKSENSAMKISAICCFSYFVFQTHFRKKLRNNDEKMREF